MERLFHRAAPLSPSERASFLEVHCANDPKLREELEDLLSRDRPTAGLGVPPPFESSPEGQIPKGVPSEIGPYSILSELGRGGMGVVYLAKDPNLGRRVALKVLPDQLARNERQRARFSQEARLLASMNHPNVAIIHSLESDGDTHFLTMEHVEGVSLKDRIENEKITLDSALSIGRQVARAVEAAHERSIIHGDLKPANMMVDAEDRAKVLDFGLSSILADPTLPNEMQSPELAAGTPGYMSPELLRGQSGSERSDLFSFGCVFYEILTGVPCIPGNTVDARISATLDPERDLNEFSEETPASVRNSIRSMVAEDLDDRPESMSAVRRIIEEVIEERRITTLLAARPERATPRPHNIPAQITSFVGRDEDIAVTIECLKANRLVTLTGVGGCGKTRLAIFVAERLAASFRDGIFFIEFSRIAEAENVNQAILSALGLGEVRNTLAMDTISAYLDGKQILLVLDNCEHVLDTVAHSCEAILRIHSGPRILATSREPLDVTLESVRVVSTLPTPAEGTEATVEIVSQHAATELFVLRAQEADRTFVLTDRNAASVVEICRRLDGIPLAIELAAARVKVLTPAELAERLDDRFRILTGGNRTSLPQHQTLHGLIDWSYQLLDEKQQILLQRLSIFSGGWSLEAAELVCSGQGIEGWEILDVFTRLLEKCLVERTPVEEAKDPRARYRMLETIREYATERLIESGERATILARYADYFCQAAAHATRNVMGAEQVLYLHRLDRDYENFRSVIRQCSQPECNPLPGLRIAASLHIYWEIKGHRREASEMCTRLLAHPKGQERTRHRASCLIVGSILSYQQGALDQAETYGEESASIAREIGALQWVANSATILGSIATTRCEYDAAMRHHEESAKISRQLGNEGTVATSLANLGNLAFSRGDLTSARRFLEECASIREKRTDRWGLSLCLSNLGAVALAEGELEEAKGHFQRCRSLHEESGNQVGLAALEKDFGAVAIFEGDLDRAKGLLEGTLPRLRESGNSHEVSEALLYLGFLAMKQELWNTARHHLFESLALRHRADDTRGVLESLQYLGLLATQVESDLDASQLFGAVESFRRSLGIEMVPREKQLTERAVLRLQSELGHDEHQRRWNTLPPETLAELVALVTASAPRT